MSMPRMISAAMQAEVRNNGASIVALSYSGAKRIFSKYSDMADAKALLESIARNFGSRLGNRGIRVNTISQSPTKTTAGSGIEGFNHLYDFAEKLSPLGNASAEECAELVVVLLSDLTRRLTMQNIYNDVGVSSLVISASLLASAYGDEDI